MRAENLRACFKCRNGVNNCICGQGPIVLWISVSHELDAKDATIARLSAVIEYLRTRVKEITDELDHAALGAMESWPKGANGPIAIAAYESMAERQRKAVHMLRAALMRTSDPNVVITDPEASEKLLAILAKATPKEGEK